MELAGEDTSCKFRAAGEASSFFPELPAVSAGFDIGFGSASGWVVAATGRSLRSLDEVNRFRTPILDAYRRGLWKPDWALVISIADAERMTLLVSQARDTKVALAVSANVSAVTPMQAQLTAEPSLMAASQRVTHRITTGRSPIGCSALRVRDPWWRSADVGDLANAQRPSDPVAARDDEFWEDVDLDMA
jgi:hypothetical protein